MSEQMEQHPDDVQDDQLAALPAERLAAMLREKRKAEASYRTKLRDVEAERDALAGKVTGYQSAAFSKFAVGERVLPAALEDVAAKVDLSTLLGEDGQLDQAKAKTALAELRTAKPHYFAPIPGASGVDFSGSSGEPPKRPEASWADVLS